MTELETCFLPYPKMKENFLTDCVEDSTGKIIFFIYFIIFLACVFLSPFHSLAFFLELSRYQKTFLSKLLSKSIYLRKRFWIVRVLLKYS